MPSDDNLNKTELLLIRVFEDNSISDDLKSELIEDLAYPDQNQDYAAGTACAVCPPPHARKKFVENLLKNKWISFQYPHNYDYSGLEYEITLSCGKKINGTLDESGYIYKKIYTDATSASIRLKKINFDEEKALSPKITKS